MTPRVRNLIVAIAVVAAIVTFNEFVFPQFRLAVVNPELRVALESAQTLIAVLVTHLLYGRFRRSRLLTDFMLAYGTGMLAAANLFFVIGPVARPGDGVFVYETWAPLLTRLVGAISIAYASWGVDRRYTPSRSGIRLLVAHLVSLLAIAATVGLFSGHLPPGVEASLSSPGGGEPVINGHPVLLAAQVVLMALHWAAAAGFARSASKGDALTNAFAVGFVLGGFSRLIFFLHPSVYTSVVQTGDLLRLSCYLALLVGAEREIHSYWNGLAHAAVADERRRTARELHDGLMQELSFIRSRTSSLRTGRSDPLALDQVAEAAERALDESRLAVQVLSGEQSEEPVSALRRAAKEITERAGVHVEVEAPERIQLLPAVTDALGRIVREACSNAIRHGQAGTIVLRLEPIGRSRLRLTITDDGIGFNPDVAAKSTGFGLTSMRDRARALGGEFRVSSSAGEGTSITVVVPH
ncbi:MAG TPA: sensor histidine kinase [Acidimicrobiales bacterium]|nr:sensor histidine kinase [Acidimicrobiales bacterium]